MISFNVMWIHMPLFFSFSAQEIANVCQTYAGVTPKFFHPYWASAGLDVKRAEVAMCNAVQIGRGSLSS
jgi:hypothetical protein